LKKGITLVAVLVGVLAVTSGAFAAKQYLITSSSQIKNGAVKLHDLSPGARKALHGKKGAKGDRGPAGPQGPKGDIGSQGPQGPAGKPAPTLQRLAGDFSGTNASVATSLDGVQFGPYSNGGAWGGSVRYNGANGLTLDQIHQLSYEVMYSAADAAPIGEAYLRIFLNNDEHDVVFDATQCATTVPTKNVFHKFEVVGKDVRYDDDSCDGVAPDQQHWSDVVAAHGKEKISGIYVTTGFSGGSDLTALLRGLSVNEHQFTFGSA
jgi:hypothetical protein